MLHRYEQFCWRELEILALLLKEDLLFFGIRCTAVLERTSCSATLNEEACVKL